MTSMDRIRPLIRDMVMARTEMRILPSMWEDAYRHVPNTDITADRVALAIAEYRQEREDIVVLKSRPEPEADG